jgi:hypothetical protein
MLPMHMPTRLDGSGAASVLSLPPVCVVAGVDDSFGPGVATIDRLDECGDVLANTTPMATALSTSTTTVDATVRHDRRRARLRSSSIVGGGATGIAVAWLTSSSSCVMTCPLSGTLGAQFDGETRVGGPQRRRDGRASNAHGFSDLGLCQLTDMAQQYCLTLSWR